MNVPWQGVAECEAASEYVGDVNKRQRKEISNVAIMTSWKHKDIEAKARANGDIPFALVEPGTLRETGPEAEARALYQDAFWWRSLFPTQAELDAAEDALTEE